MPLVPWSRYGFVGAALLITMWCFHSLIPFSSDICHNCYDISVQLRCCLCRQAIICDQGTQMYLSQSWSSWHACSCLWCLLRFLHSLNCATRNLVYDISHVCLHVSLAHTQILSWLGEIPNASASQDVWYRKRVDTINKQRCFKQCLQSHRAKPCWAQQQIILLSADMYHCARCWQGIDWK